jgi:diguanylate cyclase (GGDEF)-like protein/PAS domain S-box-containing protein
MMSKSEVERLDLKILLEHAHIGVIIHRLDTSIVYANPTALELLDLQYNQVIGVDAYSPEWYFIDEFQQRLPVDAYPVNKVSRTRSPLVNEVIGRYRPASREADWFLVNAYYEGEDGNADGFIVVTFNEISSRRHLFSYRDIIENTRDVVIVTEADNLNSPFGPRIVFVNHAFEELTGYSADEAIGETPRILQGRGTDRETLDRIRKAIVKQKPIRETILNYTKDGRPYWLDLDIFPLFNGLGKVSHFAAIERDVTEQTFYSDQLEKRNEDLKRLKDNLEIIVEEKTRELRDTNFNLQRLAHYDELTGIANRRCFKEQAHRHARTALRYGHLIAVGMIDIDRFKKINDGHGHDVGDAVLAEAARRFQEFFRAEDVYGRLGGEEFGFLIHVKSPEAATGVSERLLRIFSDQPVDAGGTEIPVTISIGVRVCKPDDSFNLEEQLRIADEKLYEAKRNGRNRLECSAD